MSQKQPDFLLFYANAEKRISSSGVAFQRHFVYTVLCSCIHMYDIDYAELCPNGWLTFLKNWINFEGEITMASRVTIRASELSFFRKQFVRTKLFEQSSPCPFVSMYSNAIDLLLDRKQVRIEGQLMKVWLINALLMHLKIRFRSTYVPYRVTRVW
jgi:hypothetical protein